jgi:hypothetical protein
MRDITSTAAIGFVNGNILHGFFDSYADWS